MSLEQRYRMKQNKNDSATDFRPTKHKLKIKILTFSFPFQFPHPSQSKYSIYIKKNSWKNNIFHHKSTNFRHRSDYENTLKIKVNLGNCRKAAKTLAGKVIKRADSEGGNISNAYLKYINKKKSRRNLDNDWSRCLIW